MPDSSLWERAVQEAKEAERAANEAQEAVKAEKLSGRTSYRALAAQRHPLLQAYGEAVQTMSEKWERAWAAWNPGR